MRITSKAKGRICAVFVFFAALALYWTTMYNGFCPGASAQSAAIAMGLEPNRSVVQMKRIETVSITDPFRYQGAIAPEHSSASTVRNISAELRTRHLLWRAFAHRILDIPWKDAASRLNLLSVFFAALSVTLAFALGRGLSRFLNFHDSPVSTERQKRAATATGFVVALSLAAQTPFWIAATRCMPGSFDIFLYLFSSWLLFTATIHHRPVLFFFCGFSFAITIFETDVGILMGLLFFAISARALFVCGLMNIRAWANLLVGTAFGVIGYLLLSRLSLGPSSSLYLPFHEFISVIKLSAEFLFSGAFFDDRARILAFFFAWLPFLVAIPLMIWHSHESRTAGSDFLTFLLAATSFIALTNSSISPWGAYKVSYPASTPAFFAFMSSTVILHLTSSGAMRSNGLLFNLSRNNDFDGEDDEFGLNDAPIARLLFWIIFGIILLNGFLSWRDIRDGRDSLVAHTAQEFAKHLDGHTWMTSTTESLDTMVRIYSSQNGTPTRFINHSGDAISISMLRNAVLYDPAFHDIPIEISSLTSSIISTNINEFIVTWITNDPNVGKKLLLDSPILWEKAGRTAVPAIIGYRALEKGETIDWESLTREHISFWNEIRREDRILGPATPLYIRNDRLALRNYICDIGRNLVEQLLENDQAALANKVLGHTEVFRQEPEITRREDYFF